MQVHLQVQAQQDQKQWIRNRNLGQRHLRVIETLYAYAQLQESEWLARSASVTATVPHLLVQFFSLQLMLQEIESESPTTIFL